MPWVRLDEHFTEHPKVLSLGDYAPLCGWLHICAIAWCNRHLTDGFIPDGVATRLTHFENLAFHLEGHVNPSDVITASALVEQLVAIGLWHKVNAGYEIHDYLDYQPSREDTLSLRKQKANAGRIGGKHTAEAKQDSSTPQAEAKHKPSRPTAEGQAKSKPVPVPVSDPHVHTHTEGARAGGFGGQKPLAYKQRLDVAWPGRPPVPSGLHAEFIDKLGGDRAEADARLIAWYPVASAAYDGKPIGDDDWKFWRLRFREWVGTTATPPGPRIQTPADLEAETDAAMAEIAKWKAAARVGR